MSTTAQAARTGTATQDARGPWPLAGSAEFAATDEAWRAALAARFESDLRTHVVEPWFPRSIDRVAGGFWDSFDRRWRRLGDGRRMLEFQARQTRTAARLGLAYPAERERWAEIALYGLGYIGEAMADREAGGWYWLVDRARRPLHGATKHAHGVAYLVSTAVEVYQLTGQPQALALAQDAFAWLEAHHHDAEHGGYHGWVTRDGRPILRPADLPAGASGGKAPLAEPLGHGLGLKDANVNCDLLEAFQVLAEVSPEALVLARLDELYGIVTRRLITPAGAIHYMTHVDWTPVPTLERYGYLLQQPFRLALAAVLLDRAAHAWQISRRLIDHALERAWDARRGLFIEAGAAELPDSIGRQSLRIRQHDWWLQTEALRTLALAVMREPGEPRYRRTLDALVLAVERELIDRRAGGWYTEPARDVPLRNRLRGEPHKGTPWKDASHEADSYMAAVRMLRGLPPTAPLGATPVA